MKKIAFIKDYVINPDIEFGMCHAMAIEKFGVKGKLNEEELDAVAKWVYDYYIDKKFD